MSVVGGVEVVVVFHRLVPFGYTVSACNVCLLQSLSFAVNTCSRSRCAAGQCRTANNLPSTHMSLQHRTRESGVCESVVSSCIGRTAIAPSSPSVVINVDARGKNRAQAVAAARAARSTVALT